MFHGMITSTTWSPTLLISMAVFTGEPTELNRLVECGFPNRMVVNGRSGIAALEDKIVQQAVVWVLQRIYEQDFLGFSYGFRPGRQPT